MSRPTVSKSARSRSNSLGWRARVIGTGSATSGCPTRGGLLWVLGRLSVRGDNSNLSADACVMTRSPASTAPRPPRRWWSVARRIVRAVVAEQSAALQAGLLFAIVGIIGVVNDVQPYGLGQGQPRSLVVDLVNIAVGVGCFALPWRRWDVRWTLALACIAFANIGWANTVTKGTGPSYGIYFIVVFVWVGAWHRQWTALLLSPVAALAYLMPVFAGVAVPAGTMTSISLVIPVGVLVAETIAHSVTLARRGEGLLHHQALYDALTGLPNRALILDRAEGMLARGRRTLTPAAALFVDLDGFKDVNDSLGHAAGDHLLRLVADRLTSVVRQADSVGRLGGDEFVVLVEDAAMGASPDLVAQRILQVLRQPFFLGDVSAPHVVTASIGIATGQYPDADQLLRDADFALYQAKHAGKNGFAVFQPSMLDKAAGGELEADLRAAVGTDQFFLLYQATLPIGPQTADGAQSTGVEALLRWQHPTRGVLGPREFGPILEDTGLVVTVGRWVLAEACRAGSRWNRAGLRVAMSVTISARQLDTHPLVGDVRDALEASGLEPASLTLELNESAFLQQPERAMICLSAVKLLGVQIAIEEFGTCYSSLASRRGFPVDMVKIDQAVIAALTTTDEARAIVHALIGLGKTLGLRTLPQGGEEPEQLAALCSAGCDTAEGLLYSQALNAVNLEHLLYSNQNPAEPTRRAGLLHDRDSI